MAETVSPVALQAAQAYEDLFVTALFAEWTPRVLDAARVASGDDVLDVACGTGVLARAASACVGASGSVAGLDLDPAMLAVAQRITPEVAWHHGDAVDLPFEDGTFDAVVSQFGLMFFADRAGAIGEMVRVLRPEGRLAVAVWDVLEASPAYPIEVELLDRLAGPSAAEALRAPFALGDRDQLEQLFDAAGVAGVEVATTRGTARFPSVRSMVEADLRGWLPVMGVHLDEDTVARILEEAERAFARLVAQDGTLMFESPAHVVTGVRHGGPEASAA